jgi:hypothetical protein
MTPELNKFIAERGGLRKAADLLQARLDELGARLQKIKAEDEFRRSFLEATIEALIVANLHQAPARLQ